MLDFKRKITILSIFTFLLSNGPVMSNIDSLKTQLSKSSPKGTIDILNQLAKSFYTVSPDSILKYSEKSLNESQQINYVAGIAEAANITGYAYSLKRDFDRSNEHLSNALELFSSIMDSIGLASANNNLGTLNLFMNNRETALEYYIASMKIAEKLDDPVSLVKSYVNIGILLNTMRDFPRSVEYYRKALTIKQHLKSEIQIMQIYVNLCDIYNEMATVYNKQPQLDSAIFYGRKALELAKAKNHLYGIAKASYAVSSPIVRAGLYKEGLEVIELAMEKWQALGDSTMVKYAYLNKAFALEGLGKYEEAMKIADYFLSINHSLKYDVFRLKHLIYKGQGNHRSSLEYYEKYSQIRDSILSSRSVKELGEIQTKYETEKKERRIEKLTQETEIQDLKLAQQNLYMGGMLLFIVLIAGIGYLFFRQNKIRQEQQVTIMEQKMLRTQMDPHFLFNALMAIQNYLFQNKPDEAGIYMAKFAKLMRQTLENSRQEFITLDEEINTLKNYIELQQLRFQNKFDFDIQADESIDLESTSIPPMFAQPFVENAIEHGMSKMDSGGLIQIRFSLADDLIRLEIQDNGSGIHIDNTVNTEVSEHKSLATTITRERIEVINRTLRKKIELLVDNVIGQEGQTNGTLVKLMVPYKNL